MVILGLSDGPAPGAAVVIDDHLASAEESQPSDGPGLPLAAARRALRAAGLQPPDVTIAVLAGRYSPPLSVRRRARLRRWAEDPFSTSRALTTRWERFLRGTGLGAADADRARDWLSDALTADGYRPKKITLVDQHKALASSVYRTIPHDRATIVVVQPDGDGVFASVHRAAGGQVDRVSADRATTGVHLLLPRALTALGVPDLASASVLARDASPDPALRAALSDVASYAGRFSGRPGPERRGESPWTELARDPVIGAATLLAHVRELVSDLVRHHHLEGVVEVAGDWFADPGVLGLPVPVHVSPFRGSGGLAVGAAVEAAGLTPSVVRAALGAELDDAGDGAEPVSAGDVAAVLATGAPWIRCRGRSAPGAAAPRHRGVWVRADDERAVARVRERLEVPPTAPTVVMCAVPPADLPDTLRPAFATGVTWKGRTWIGPGLDPAVAARAEALAARGVAEIALFPLSTRARPDRGSLAEAQAVARSLGAPLEFGARFEPGTSSLRSSA